MTVSIQKIQAKKKTRLQVQKVQKDHISSHLSDKQGNKIPATFDLLHCTFHKNDHVELT